jgi:mannose-6-phosphate isomerase-like protein (cupin superfamily)
MKLWWIYKMDVKEIPITKSDDRGVIYSCDDIEWVIRKKDSVSGNHNHPEREILFLLEGEIELTVGEQIKKLKAPVKVDIPSNTHHKILALTDIKMFVEKSR